MNNSEDPRDALAALESTNDRLARRMRWPIWRHFAGGLLMTLVVAAVALPHDVAAMVFVTAMVLMLLIVRDDKKRHGMFVSGYQRGRTVWIVAAIIVLTLSALVIVLTLAGLCYAAVMLANGDGNYSLGGLIVNGLWGLNNILAMSIMVRAAFWKPEEER